MFQTAQASFLQVITAGNRQAIWLAQAGGLRVQLTLSATAKVTPGMLALGRGILASADLGVGQ